MSRTLPRLGLSLRISLRWLLLAVAVISTGLGLAGCVLSTSPTSVPSPTAVPFADVLAQLCWAAYSPTNFDPTVTPVVSPSEEDVREDLRVLAAAGFNGLVTYSSAYTDSLKPGQPLDIPRLAQEAGFDGMIVGVWNPSDEAELSAAEKASSYPVVRGYCIGNEGLDERYDLKTLTTTMERIRRNTGRPVSTTEQANDYYENTPLWAISDWVFPNVHPYFAKRRDPREAAAWTAEIFETLNAVSDKPLIFKEVGLPTSGDDGLSESGQAQYYRLLRQTPVIYVIFEAFDAPWKHLTPLKADGTLAWPDPEPFWGVFTADRVAKEAVTGICSPR